jgi:putative nucleotidyltransferase with HDIG domain
MDVRPGSRLLKFYVSAIACGAIVALVLAGRGEIWDWSSRFSNGLIAILAVAVAAEMSSVSMQLGTATMSVAFIPFLAAIFLFGPFWAMAVAGATFVVIDLLVRQKPWIKVVFNVSKEMLSLAFAASVYQLFGGTPSIYHFNLVPIAVLLSAVAYAAASSIAVSFVVSLSEGIDFTAVWGRIFGGSALYDLFVTPVPALLAYVYVRWELGGVVALAAPLFLVRHVYVQNLRLQQASRELLELMVKQIEARDPYTSGHSQRVSEYARILAREAGISFRQGELVATAALLHDVGKTYSEYAPLLLKEGKLTSEEKNLLQTHPVRSAELVSTISTLRGPVEEAVRHHHENFDGTGYPDGLAGQGIPIGARIIMIADTLDAMTTDRPYRKALPFERVIEEFRRYASKQFDPVLVEVVIKSSAIRRLVAAEAHTPPESEPATFNRASVTRLERIAV